MPSYDENGNSEYSSLMARGRDAERTWQICWTASGLVGSVVFSWAIAARNSALMLPVILTVAYGFYSMIHGRRQTRLIAGYLEEFFEKSSSGPQWFTRLGHLKTVPGFTSTGDWLVTCLADVVAALAVVFAWIYVGGGTRGAVMAGIATGFGVAFIFHSITETASLRRNDYSTMWRQAIAPPAETTRRLSRVPARS